MPSAEAAETDGAEVAFRIKLPEECPLYGHFGEIISASPHFDDSGCQCRFVICPPDDNCPLVVKSSAEIDEDTYIYHDVLDHGITPIFDRVEGDELVVSALLDTKRDACPLFENLKRHGTDVEVIRVVSDRNKGQRNERMEVDKRDLTEKQQRALQMAVNNGYYSNPREVELETLADREGISRQAFAYRLRQAESKILEQVVPDDRKETNGF